MSDMSFEYSTTNGQSIDSVIDSGWSARRATFFCLLTCGTFWALAGFAVFRLIG